MKQLVFVYGSLKRGFANHGRFLAKSRFIGEAQTKPVYRMVSCGAYPALIPAKRGVSVRGEVFEVDDVTKIKLDRLEGVDRGMYRCVPAKLTTKFASVPWVYVSAREAHAILPDAGTVWVNPFTDPDDREDDEEN